MEQTIVRPLEQANFLAPLPAQERFPKRDGRYRAVFGRAVQELPFAEAEPALTAGAAETPPARVVGELRRRGLGGKAASHLVAAHPTAYIEEIIDFLDHPLGSGTVLKPAAWLRRAAAGSHYRKDTAALAGLEAEYFGPGGMPTLTRSPGRGRQR